MEEISGSPTRLPPSGRNPSPRSHTEPPMIFPREISDGDPRRFYFEPTNPRPTLFPPPEISHPSYLVPPPQPQPQPQPSLYIEPGTRGMISPREVSLPPSWVPPHLRTHHPFHTDNIDSDNNRKREFALGERRESDQHNPGKGSSNEMQWLNNFRALTARNIFSASQWLTLPKIKTNLQLVVHILLEEAGKGFPYNNVVCSSLSLNALLNMVAVGSKGDTLEQLLRFLGSSSLDDVKSKSSSIMTIASKESFQNNNGSGGGPAVSFVNGVWVDKHYTVKQSYQEVLKAIYMAEAKNVDFAKPDQVAEDVNSWVHYATQGLIKRILDPQSLNDESLLILGNALYFKGAWDRKFDATMTKTKDFHLLNGDTVLARFMTSYKEYFYRSFDGFKVLKIPYRRGNDSRIFSMYFFLPDERDGLQNLLQKFNSDPEFMNQHFQFQLKETKFDELWIPKFKFTYTLEVKKTLMDMGLTLPFMPDCVDLTEMVRGHKLYVSKIIHKAVIEIDEAGTEAAAASLAVKCFGSSMWALTQRICFVADHPFLFVIREETTGAVFFTGTVLNPVEQD